MPLDLDYTPRGGETLMRRVRRVGFAAVLMAGVSVVGSIITTVLWGVPRWYQMFLSVLALWFITLAIHAFNQFWQMTKKTIERLGHLAVIDEVSGSFEPLYLKLRLDEEEERTSRYGGVTTLLYIDVAQLEEATRHFGRQVADAVLENVAGTMVAGLRQCDVLGRFGGNEFVAILPETDRRNARLVAERLRESLEEFSFDPPRGGTINTIRLSIGIAAFPINGQTMDNVITAARNAMKGAQSEGGNKVRVSDQFIRTDEIGRGIVKEVRGEKRESG